VIITVNDASMQTYIELSCDRCRDSLYTDINTTIKRLLSIQLRYKCKQRRRTYESCAYICIEVVVVRDRMIVMFASVYKAS
jgi:hypothetical protein